jgi:L-serine dehydratase
MVAARRFLLDNAPLDEVAEVKAELYGSLALTGVGHATDKAVLLGLMGETRRTWCRPRRPATGGCRSGRPTEAARRARRAVQARHASGIPHGRIAAGAPERHALHADPQGWQHRLKVYYSVGGGFIREEGEAPAAAAEASPCLTRSTPWTNCWRMACAAA